MRAGRAALERLAAYARDRGCRAADHSAARRRASRGARARASACACGRSRTHCGIAHVAACNELRNRRVPRFRSGAATQQYAEATDNVPDPRRCRASAAAASVVDPIQVRRCDPGLRRCGRALSVRRGRRTRPRGFLRPVPSPGEVGHATSDTHTCASPRATNVAMCAGVCLEEPSAFSFFFFW